MLYCVVIKDFFLEIRILMVIINFLGSFYLILIFGIIDLGDLNFELDVIINVWKWLMMKWYDEYKKIFKKKWL